MPATVLETEHEAIRRELEELLTEMASLGADDSETPWRRAMRLLRTARRLKMLDRRYRALLN